MRSILDKETARIMLITGLRSNDCRSADYASLRFLVGISVGGVEAARETTHHFKMRFSLGRTDNFLALSKSAGCLLGCY